MNALSPREVATHYGISIATVYRWVRKGHLPALRLGKRVLRFTPAELVAYEKGTATIKKSTPVGRNGRASLSMKRSEAVLKLSKELSGLQVAKSDPWGMEYRLFVIAGLSLEALASELENREKQVRIELKR